MLFTHDHADHTHGLDDLRPINHHRDGPLDIYADAATLATLYQRFDYAFEPSVRELGWYKVQLIAHEITGPFRVSAIGVAPFGQDHGPSSSLGFRFGAVAYSTDVHTMTESAFAALTGVDVWIVDCLRPEPNPFHSHLDRTLDWIARLGPRRAVLTHMSHAFDYDLLAAELPTGVEPAYDGLAIDCNA